LLGLLASFLGGQSFDALPEFRRDLRHDKNRSIVMRMNIDETGANVRSGEMQHGICANIGKIADPDDSVAGYARVGPEWRSAMARSMLTESATPATKAIAGGSTSCAACSAISPFLSTIATRAPAAANAPAVSRPMPLASPVTITALPSNRINTSVKRPFARLHPVG
jgi:hypothetical protein